jgi:hypothetical protein
VSVIELKTNDLNFSNVFRMFAVKLYQYYRRKGNVNGYYVLPAKAFENIRTPGFVLHINVKI